MDLVRTLKHAGIGLVVAAVVGLVPGVGLVGPLVGGAVAGYLHGTDAKGGAIAGGAVGALAAALTLAFLLLSVVVGVGRGTIGWLDWLPAAGGAAWVVLLFVVGFGVLVAVTTVGGVLGAVVARERRRDADGTGPAQG